MQEPYTLGFTRCGDPAGQPLCLIHGWGLDSSFLLPIASMFPERDVYLIDLPGYGKSRHLEVVSVDFDACAHALAATVPPDSDVMAVSMGSLYAIKALSLIPAPQVSSLVTICSNARFPCDPNWPGLSSDLLIKCRTMLTPARCRRLLHLFIKLQTIDNHAVGAEFMDAAFKNYQLPSYQVLMNGITLASFVDVREELQYLKVPCLQLFGGQDRLVPASLIYALKDTDLRSSYIFARSAHNPYLTEAALFEQVVREFFDRVHSFLR